MDLETAEISLVLDHLRRVSQDEPIFCAFVNGSRCEGFPNRNSDLDIWVVTDEKNGWEYLKSNETEIHIRYLPLKKVESLLDSLIKGELDYSWFAASLFHRIKSGGVVYGPGDYLKRLNTRFSEESIKKSLVGMHCGDVVSWLNDAQGAVLSKDSYLTVVACRGALESAAQALLCSREIYNPNPKWIHIYLGKLLGVGHPMFRKYSSMIMSGVDPTNGADSYYEQSTKMASEMILMAQLDSS